METLFDCENLESTIDSLCEIFRCSPGSLHEALLQIDIDTIYEQEDPYCTPDQYLYKSLLKIFGAPNKPHNVCWFHLTRTSRSNDFHEGILPLGMALDSIWEMIFSIFRQSEHLLRLQQMRTEGVPNYHYQSKTPDPFHWGPFAMLVRDVAFVPERLSNHDYLGLPEIIEDICNGYRDKYKLSIYEDVVNALEPCIVKFIVRGGNDSIIPAIYYAYRGIRGESVPYDGNTCFDAGGKVIPKRDILKIGFIEKP